METQTHALFGDVKQLTKQMQEAVGEARYLEGLKPWRQGALYGG